MANRSDLRRRGHLARGGFTLLELMVASTVFILVLAISIVVLGQVSGIWRRSVQQTEAFQSARIGFDLLTRNLSQATLNTYLDYLDAQNRAPSDPAYSGTPVKYVRQSDLNFVCEPAGQGGTPGTAGTGSAVFFQAPLGYVQGSSSADAAQGDLTALNKLLNTCGYFVQFGPDPARPPHVETPPKYRYRLMQLLQPAEQNAIFKYSANEPKAWYTNSSTYCYPVADNIVALILRPLDPGDPALLDGYGYNSKSPQFVGGEQAVTANQLPPVVEVTMITIDEASATRLQQKSGTAEPEVIREALSKKFEDRKKYDDELEQVKSALADQGINYRVFSSAVPLRESKWTR